MSEVSGYYLTKVTDRRWAERLLDGEIYARSLSHFGDILHRPKAADNAFRGDLLEGAVAVSGAAGSDSTFVKDAFGDTFPENGHVVWLSESIRQLRIYSLFCFLYSTQSSGFVAPDVRLREFGDTAVMIVRPIDFFARLRRSLAKRSIDLSMCAAKRVTYCLDCCTPGIYDEFSKSPTYSWQNEYRLSIDVSMGRLDRLAWDNMSDLAKVMFLDRGGEVDLASFGIDVDEGSSGQKQWQAMSVLGKVRFLAERSSVAATIDTREPLVLQLGCIRDICALISTEDLLALKIQRDKFAHNPYVVPPLHRVG